MGASASREWDTRTVWAQGKHPHPFRLVTHAQNNCILQHKLSTLS